MAYPDKKPQAPQKPAWAPKPVAPKPVAPKPVVAPKPAAPATGGGCGGGAPAQKPAGPTPGQK
ncbi:MAG: hypothetical protein MUP16_10630 [Sedimentisphaerales bacterium]|nr:hypothetical protein [Sedimentisphaerales bacterium]